MNPALERDDVSGSGRPGIPFPKMSDYVAGICLLLMVVILWTSSNYLTQYMYTGGYQKPFLVTYTTTSAFVIYLIPYYLRKAQEGNRSIGYHLLARDRTSSHVPQPFNDPPRLTAQETASLAVRFCFLWFVANWSINAALAYTSVASTTVLSSMSGIFTLAVGRMFRVETLSLVKIGAVLISFGGVILISVSDSSLHPELHVAPHTFHPRPVIGDILALLSSFFYAIYMVYLKVQIKDESRIDMQLFFGFVGLFSMFLCWPVVPLLHVLGVESFELPNTRQAMVAILINMFITFLSDYIYVIAMLKTTPLVVTVGISLTIPLAVVCDFLLGKLVTKEVVIGALSILTGFIVVGSENSKEWSRQHLGEGVRPEEAPSNFLFPEP